MYRDNTLIPSEAVRLLALGILANKPVSYAELAREIRHFTGRIVGPSLDLVGAPLEVLKVEGLVQNEGGVPDKPEGDAPGHDNQLLEVTDQGRTELLRLLAANVRPQVSDLNKLIVALKMRFLHLMDAADQRIQAELLHDISERELARLIDLREYHGLEAGHLQDWLDLEIAQSRARLDWTLRLRDSLA
jgi:DNA-binding PadR family transcriptional regulator